MTRLMTLASTGLFATGLAIFPVSVFAQPNAATGTDTKAQAAAPVAGHDAKTSMPAKAAAKDKPAVKTDTTKTSAVKPDPAGAPAKVGG